MAKGRRKLGRAAVDEERFNMSVRKFLKHVGVLSARLSVSSVKAP
jgi:hypothetical protein